MYTNPIFPAKILGKIADEFMNKSISDIVGADFISTVPPLNIVDTTESYIVQLAAPGLTKEDFKLTAKDGFLTVSANKSVSEEEVKPQYTRREFQYTSFSRRVNLSKDIDKDAITARYDMGILTINLPKIEEAKANSATQIEIK